MPKELFVDTSAWIALADKNDNWHPLAPKVYPELVRAYGQFVTTNLIVAETHIALRERIGFVGAMGFIVNLRTSARLVRVLSNDELERQAEAILEQYDDQDISYTDAVSFAVMKQRSIKDVFTYDHHFRALGFHLVG